MEKEIELFFSDKNNPALFLSVIDSSSNEPVQDAFIGIIGPNEFDQTITTGKEGTAFFPLNLDPVVLMENSDYTIEIRTPGYQDYVSTISINNLTKEEIKLNPI
jgi:hypothetical protein